MPTFKLCSSFCTARKNTATAVGKGATTAAAAAVAKETTAAAATTITATATLPTTTATKIAIGGKTKKYNCYAHAARVAPDSKTWTFLL